MTDISCSLSYIEVKIDVVISTDNIFFLGYRILRGIEKYGFAI